MSYNAYAFDCLSKDKVNKIAEAIRKAENSKKFPYGIKSINTYSNESLARKYCINTINNNWLRYNNSDKKLSFIEFLGARYSPTKSSNLNTNWVRNVNYFLNIK